MEAPLEHHPWEAFVPPHAKVLIMGTFPPQLKRRAMDFYYPNRTNDFWFVTGLIFRDDRDAFYDRAARSYRLDDIKRLLTDKGIALSDTGRVIRRLANNASDKYLDIVEPVDLASLLARMPELRAIATTGEKAADVLASLTGTIAPAMGAHVMWNGLQLWRLPSTSRAYPLALEKKADFYRRFYQAADLNIAPQDGVIS